MLASRQRSHRASPTRLTSHQSDLLPGWSRSFGPGVIVMEKLNGYSQKMSFLLLFQFIGSQRPLARRCVCTGRLGATRSDLNQARKLEFHVLWPSFRKKS